MHFCSANNIYFWYTFRVSQYKSPLYSTYSAPLLESGTYIYIWWISGRIKNCHNITMNLMHRFFFKESTFKLSVWVLATDTETNLKWEWRFLAFFPVSRLTNIVTYHCLVFPFSNFSTSYAKEGAIYEWLLWVWWL